VQLQRRTPLLTDEAGPKGALGRRLWRSAGWLAGFLAFSAFMLFVVRPNIPIPNSPATERLFRAIGRSDYAGAIAALDEGASPNQRGEKGVTPLTWAIMTKNTHLPGQDKPAQDRLVLAELLARGADPNLLDGHFQATPVGVAAVYDDLSALGVLLDAGGQVANVDHRGAGALTLAVEGRNMRSVAFLLGVGADPTEPDRRGRTALDAAREGGDPTLLALLERRRQGSRGRETGSLGGG
jgi:ankyrin repeat protein